MHFRCLLLLSLLGCSDARETPPGDLAPVIGQDRMAEVPALRAALDRVTPEHATRAAAFEAEGRATLSQARFAPAAKAFGAAVLYEPTPVRLYGAAVTHARIPRPRESPTETTRAKTRDVAEAERLLRAAEALSGDDPSLHALIAAERSCLARIESIEPGDPCHLPRVP